MENIQISGQIKQILLGMQRNEMTEHAAYTKIAKRVKDPKNKQVLQAITQDEKVHAIKKRFGEMALISLGVAALSFVVGLLVK